MFFERYGRQMDVNTTLCSYWVLIILLDVALSKRKADELKLTLNTLRL